MPALPATAPPWACSGPQKLSGKTLPDILGAVTSFQINRYNFETIDIVRANFDQWSRELSTPGNPVDFHMIQVSFDDEKDERQRHFFNNLPTSFSLAPEQVEKLKAAGRQLLKANPGFQRLARKLSARPPN